MPKIARRVETLRASLFSTLARRLEGYEGKRYPFHIGDHAHAPPEAARLGTVDVTRLGNPYRYGHPSGEPALRAALAEKLVRQNGLRWVTADHVQIGSGATHCVSATLQALTDPGDEVLLPSPYWPLSRGIIQCVGGVAVEVPLYQRLLEDPGLDVRRTLEASVGPRTRMIYLITPNNPNGLVLDERALEAVADVARRHDLWVLSDEAYETTAFARPHVSIAILAGMADRTVSVFTFSKTYALAGLRIGYLAAPGGAARDAIGKVATHSVYNTAQAIQSAALAAIEHGAPFIDQCQQGFAAAAELVRERLRAPFHAAQGGSYVFVDLRRYGPDAMPILERLASRGVTLAPGAIFGKGYEGYARLCYTATDRETLAEGLELINAELARPT